MEFAHTVAGNPPEMVQGAKRLLQDYIGMAIGDRARMEPGGALDPPQATPSP